MPVLGAQARPRKCVGGKDRDRHARRSLSGGCIASRFATDATGQQPGRILIQQYATYLHGPPSGGGTYSHHKACLGLSVLLLFWRVNGAPSTGSGRAICVKAFRASERNGLPETSLHDGLSNRHRVVSLTKMGKSRGSRCFGSFFILGLGDSASRSRPPSPEVMRALCAWLQDPSIFGNGSAGRSGSAPLYRAWRPAPRRGVAKRQQKSSTTSPCRRGAESGCGPAARPVPESPAAPGHRDARAARG